MPKVGLIGVSANGTDVYFSTYDTLVARDHNGSALKFYDARTDGGFAEPPAPAPCAAAEECTGPGSSLAPLPEAGPEPNSALWAIPRPSPAKPASIRITTSERLMPGATAPSIRAAGERNERPQVCSSRCGVDLFRDFARVRRRPSLCLRLLRDARHYRFIKPKWPFEQRRGLRPCGRHRGACYFEYGTDTTYSLGSVPCSEEPEREGLNFEAELLNLQVGVTYHYRLVATTERGLEAGLDQTFTEAPAPTVPGLPIFSFSPEPSETQAGGHPNIRTGFYFAERSALQFPTTCFCQDPKTSHPATGRRDRRPSRRSVLQPRRGRHHLSTRHPGRVDVEHPLRSVLFLAGI